MSFELDSVDVQNGGVSSIGVEEHQLPIAAEPIKVPAVPRVIGGHPRGGSTEAGTAVGRTAKGWIGCQHHVSAKVNIRAAGIGRCRRIVCA